jgi:hypothetical protein
MHQSRHRRALLESFIRTRRANCKYSSVICSCFLIFGSFPPMTALCNLSDNGTGPYRNWFFKYKFEEPYLMYRQWRECTKLLESFIRTRRANCKYSSVICSCFLIFGSFPPMTDPMQPERQRNWALPELVLQVQVRRAVLDVPPVA